MISRNDLDAVDQHPPLHSAPLFFHRTWCPQTSHNLWSFIFHLKPNLVTTSVLYPFYSHQDICLKMIQYFFNFPPYRKQNESSSCMYYYLQVILQYLSLRELSKWVTLVTGCSCAAFRYVEHLFIFQCIFCTSFIYCFNGIPSLIVLIHTE